MSNAYRQTMVPIARSQEQIRRLLINFCVSGVQFSENFDTGEINIRFAKKIGESFRTVSVSMRVPEPPKPKRRSTRKSAADRKEQMTRATYRALHDWLKAQFVAVEFGLLSFEDVFLSHFEWLLNGEPKTIGEILKPRLEEASMRPLLTGGNRK
jgi:hypothetical protein